MPREVDRTVETNTLKEFLAASADHPEAGVGDLARARALASRLAHRLERPLRVLIAGEPGSGKSTLTNALAGDNVLTIGNMPLDMPPVFVRYGTPKTSFAGWWGEKDRRRSDTLNLRELAALMPDFIVVQGEFPRLTDINLFDIQGRDDMGADGSALLDTAGSADMVIWCSTADDPWKVRERQVWSKLPKSLRQHALLAITHGDDPQFAADFPRIFERAVQEAARHFNDVVALNGPKAMAAVRDGKVIDKAAWSASGAEQIADALDLAAATIKDEVLREARAAISAPLAPFIKEAQSGTIKSRVKPAAAEEPAEVEAPAETAKAAPEPAPAPEPKVEPKAEPAPAPKAEPAPEPKVEAKAEPAPEPKVEAKAEPTPEPTAEVKADPKVEPVVEAKSEPEPEAEPKVEAKAEPKAAAKAPAEAVAETAPAEPEPEPTPEPEPKPEPETKPAAKEAPAPKAKPEPAKADAAPPHPLLTGWNDKISALLLQIESADEVDESGFLQSCCDIVMDISNAVSEPGVLDDETNWMQSQFQDALDLLILLQIETGDEAVEDASTVLVQLGRDVAYIAARQG